MSEILDYLGRARVQTFFTEPSLTVQSDSEKADIQKIMARYQATGIMESLDEADLLYKDISEFTDYADAMREIRKAEDQFMSLPSKVREIFDHDVAVWLDTAEDEDKRDALVAAGYIEDPGGDTTPVSGGAPRGDGGEGDPPDGDGVPDGTSG